jgi:hypothetical protein
VEERGYLQREMIAHGYIQVAGFNGNHGIVAFVLSLTAILFTTKCQKENAFFSMMVHKLCAY